ncbi:hypothetical protein LB572_03170 [Mesorhizobium sp. BH1-1-5]|uniref:hypothetical protein n=1 Tax=Mesorhizobium sp. BH1-1-5 TaxID=2876661 RepID=UPI001CCE915C|nr:hypothetical protein [Mesorhizobium sp. BH1-1-5]MBZ9986094.1 hypothetical protein [Mesorhizobium sp. BH1-1-5]
MSSALLSHELTIIDPVKLDEARKAFLSVNKAIRRGKVAGKEQLDERLRRAIAAYKAGTAI